MDKSVHLIVCHFQYDTDWTDGFSVDIVHNGITRPNRGREPGAFFWWIHTNYEAINPDKTYAFLQDRPFDHAPYAITDIQPVDEFTPLGATTLTCDGEGRPHDPGLPVEQRYTEWIGEWPGEVAFTPGGQFMLPGKVLLKRPPKDYEYMEAQMSTDRNPWVMERLWKYYFNSGIM